MNHDVDAWPSAALVLETNNLDGGAGAGEAVARLEALMRRLRRQTFPLGALAEIVITHGGLAEADRARLAEAAGAPIRFVEVELDTGYYEAKNAGFAATTADVVLFGDGDCRPDPRWLERLLAPFAERGAAVVAGRTAYLGTLLGAAATALDFLYWPSPLAEGAVRNFYANNVAFRRTIFAAHPFPPPGRLHRGSCALSAIDLERAGVPIHFAEDALTLHPLPVGAAAWLRFRLRRGEDAAELAPPLARAHLPRRLGWLGRTGPLAAMTVLGVRLGYGARALARARRRDPAAPRLPMALASAAGLTLADAAGALARGAGLRVVGPRGDDDPLAPWDDDPLAPWDDDPLAAARP